MSSPLAMSLVNSPGQSSHMYHSPGRRETTGHPTGQVSLGVIMTCIDTNNVSLTVLFPFVLMTSDLRWYVRFSPGKLRPQIF